MTTRQLAAQYIKDQIDIMKKYGEAPRLDAARRKELVAEVQKTFDAMRGSQRHATSNEK